MDALPAAAGQQPAVRARAASQAAARWRGSGARRFEGVDDCAGRVEAGLIGDLDHAGGAGDVDLGEPVADHVEADDEQSARPQDGRQVFGDGAFAVGEGMATPRRRRRGCRGSRRPSGCAPARTG